MGKTGWIYMDPLASLFVGFMIIGTALPLTLRSGRMLAEAAPKDIDLKGVRKDVAAVEGVEGVHELHVWSLSQSKAIAALHLTVASDSLTDFMALSRFINPSELTNPILVAIIGAAGIGSNFLMVLLLGGHNHSH